MLSNITIGQYFPGNSFIHKMDPRMKIILTLVYIVMLFVAGNFIGLLVGMLVSVVLYFVSRVPIKMILKSMKPVLPIVLFTAILNMFFISGEPLVKFWIFTITREGLRLAIIMAIRIVCLIAGTSLMTYTTSPIALTDGIESLLSPLKKIKFPVHELAMMMTIALRFTPP